LGNSSFTTSSSQSLNPSSSSALPGQSDEKASHSQSIIQNETPLEKYQRSLRQKLQEKEENEIAIRKRRIEEGTKEIHEISQEFNQRRLKNRDKHNRDSQICQSEGFLNENPWRNIPNLVNFNVLPPTQRKDVTRMKDILIDLATH